MVCDSGHAEGLDDQVFVVVGAISVVECAVKKEIRESAGVGVLRRCLFVHIRS